MVSKVGKWGSGAYVKQHAEVENIHAFMFVLQYPMCVCVCVARR